MNASSADVLRRIVRTANEIQNSLVHVRASESSGKQFIASTTWDFTRYFPEPEPIVSRFIARGLSEINSKKLSNAYLRNAAKLQALHRDTCQATWTKLASMGPVSPKLVEGMIRAHEYRYRETLKAWEVKALGLVDDKTLQATSGRPHAESCKAKRPTESFNHDFVSFLEAHFAEEPRPSRGDKQFLAKKSGMTYRQIHVWFQNRRSRSRRAQQTNCKSKDLSPGHLSFVSTRNVHGVHPFSERCVRSSNGQLEKSCTGRANGGLSESSAFEHDKCGLEMKETPVYAFPAKYPPSITPEEDPFPCRFGDFTNFHKPRWVRNHTDISHSQNEPDLLGLVSAFEKLCIGDTWQPRVPEDNCRSWGLYTPMERTGCDVTHPYTVRPMRAPMISLVRKAASSKSCAAPLNKRCHKSPFSVAEASMSQASCSFGPVKRGLNYKNGHGSVAYANPTPMSSLSHWSSSLSTSIIASRPKLLTGPGTTLEDNPAQHAPPSPPLKRSEGWSSAVGEPSLESTLSSSVVFTPNASLLITPHSLGKSSSPLSSGSSSTSSESCSPVTPVLDTLADTDASLMTYPAQLFSDVHEQLQLPFNYRSSEISKDPLGGAFGYGLPTFQSYLQPMGAFSQGLGLCYESASLPFSSDPTYISS